MTALDPRRGVPSASSMRRYTQCPGSWMACQGLPDETSEVAETGTRIHTALETGDYTALSPDEAETAEMCAAQMHTTACDWMGGHEEEADERLYELRLGLTSLGGVVPVTEDSRATFVCTGQADVILIIGRAGLIIDYKTGRGAVEPAKENEQLRTLAVLAARRWRLDSVRVAIVQPWAGAPSVADYDAATLAASRAWLDAALTGIDTATPDHLHAGDWCHYCRAKATCPALREAALAPVERLTMSLPSDDKAARAAIFARAMEVDAELLARLMRGLRLVGWYAAAIEGAAKRRAEDDVEFQRYFRLKAGVAREKIIDVQLVFQRASELGVAADVFAAACSLTKKELEAMLRKATGLKGASLKTKMEEVLIGAAEAKETAPQLEEVGQ